MESGGEDKKTGEVADSSATLPQCHSPSRCKDQEQTPFDARSQSLGHQVQSCAKTCGSGDDWCYDHFYGDGSQYASPWLVKFERHHGVSDAQDQDSVDYTSLAQAIRGSFWNDAYNWFLTDKLYLALNRKSVSKEQYDGFRHRFCLRFFEQYDGSCDCDAGPWLARFDEVAQLADIDMTDRVWLINFRGCMTRRSMDWFEQSKHAQALLSRSKPQDDDTIMELRTEFIETFRGWSDKPQAAWYAGVYGVTAQGSTVL